MVGNASVCPPDATASANRKPVGSFCCAIISGLATNTRLARLLDSRSLAPILNHMVKYQEEAGPHLCRARRSHKARIAGAARRRREPLRQRAGAAVCDVAARDHEASRRAVGCRPDRAREDRPHRGVPPDRQADGAGDGLAEPLPALLVRKPRPPCRFCGGRPMAPKSGAADLAAARASPSSAASMRARKKSTPRGPTRKK